MTQFCGLTLADDFLNDYSDDGDQNLTQITQQGQTGGNGVATKGVNYAYNLAGQVTSQVDYTQLCEVDLRHSSIRARNGRIIGERDA